MAYGLLLFAAANAATLLWACRIVKGLQVQNAGIEFLLVLLIRIFLISATILVAGMAGLLNPLALGVFFLAALGYLLFRGAHKDLTRFSLGNRSWIFWLLILLLIVKIICHVWYGAPNSYDAVSYHLPKVSEWVRAGGFTKELGIDTHAPFPAGFELIECWWVVFLHHDVLIETAGVEFLFIAFAAIRSLALTLGLNERSAGWAGLFYAFVPALQLSVTSCLNDVPAAGLLLATFALAAAGAPIVLMIFVAGLGVGIKPTYAYALLGPAVVWFLSKGTGVSIGSLRKREIILGLCGLLVGGFWFARNWLWFGNPIYPVGTSGLVASTGELKIQFGPSASSPLKSIQSLIDSRIYDYKGPYSSLLMNISGWGPLIFACGVIALLAFLRSHPRARLLTVGFCLSLLSILVLVNYDPWNMRFVMFFPAIACIAIAHELENSIGLRIAATLAVALQIATTTMPPDISLRAFRTLMDMPWRERTVAAIAGARHPHPSIAYMVHEPIHNRGEAYLLYRPDFSCRVLYARSTTVKGLVEELRSARTDNIYLSRTSRGIHPLLEEGIRLGLIRQIEDNVFRLEGTSTNPEIPPHERRPHD
jgi:hypothetical protein